MVLEMEDVATVIAPCLAKSCTISLHSNNFLLRTFCAILMGRAAATALVIGQVGEEGAAAAGSDEERMGGLLKGTTAQNAPVTWLLLRCLLDDQVRNEHCGIIFFLPTGDTSSSLRLPPDP